MLKIKRTWQSLVRNKESIPMRLKNRIMSLVLTSALIASLAPASVFAEEEQPVVKTAEVEVSAQADGSFIVPHHEITVAADKAESYGYVDDPVKEGEVTALDALVAMHEEIYGDDFSLETKDDYLVVNNRMMKKSFTRDAVDSTFKVNDEIPNDGVINPVYGTETMYAVNQAVLTDGDNVDFAFFQSFYGMYDLDVDTSYCGRNLDGATLIAGVDVTLDVLGYSKIYTMMSQPEYRDIQKVALKGGQFALVGDDGKEITPIDGAVTDEKGNVTLKFDKPGTYHVTVIGTEEMEDMEKYVIMPYYTVYVAEETESTIVDDIWLQYDFKELSVGESADIYPRRVNQIIESDTAGIKTVVRPRFNFEIVSGDSIELSKEYSSEKVSVKAVGAGTSIVKVTYDSIYAYGKTFASTYEPNAAYVVYEVYDDENPAADINISSGIDLTSYDTVYYLKGENKTLDFKPSVDKGEIVSVSANGTELTAGEDGTYSAPLENKGNIIGITAVDEEGKAKSFYQVVDAREVTIDVKNLSRESDVIYEGDEVEVVVNGITLPVYKLSTIYNPTMYNPKWNAKGSFVSYYLDSSDGVKYVDAAGKDVEVVEGEVKGFGEQYNITDNSMILSFTNAGTYTFSGGSIFESWWGSGLGMDKLVENSGQKPNLDAPVCEGYFSSLPEFKIEVKMLPEKEIELLKAEIAELNNTIEEITAKLENAGTDSAKLKAELEEAQKALEEAKAELEKAKSEVKTDEKANDKTDDKIVKIVDKELLKKVIKFTNTKVKGLKVKRGKKKAKLSWKKVNGADGYIVYRKVGKGKFKKVKTVKGDTVKFTNKKLKKKKTYSYKVVAYMNVEGSKVLSKESKTKKVKIKK